jgi:hypothetical protein
MTLKQDAATMNRILKSEEAAAETYQCLLENSGRNQEVWALREIAQDHRQAAGLIKQQIGEMGGTSAPAGSMNIWQDIARNHESKISQDRVLLAALRRAESQLAGECRLAMIHERNESPARALLNDHIVPMLVRPGRLHDQVGEEPTLVAASHGPGIQPCGQASNDLLDA